MPISTSSPCCYLTAAEPDQQAVRPPLDPSRTIPACDFQAGEFGSAQRCCEADEDQCPIPPAIECSAGSRRRVGDPPSSRRRFLTAGWPRAGVMPRRASGNADEEISSLKPAAAACSRIAANRRCDVTTSNVVAWPIGKASTAAGLAGRDGSPRAAHQFDGPHVRAIGSPRVRYSRRIRVLTRLADERLQVDR